MLIDWFTVAAQVVNFLILVWLLKRFLYHPILAALDAREKKIAKLLADADAKKAEAIKEQEDYKHKNDEFEQQRTTLMKQATAEAKTEKLRLQDEARQAAEVLLAKRQETLRNEANNLNQALSHQVRTEVFSIARKTLSDLATTEIEERMVDVFILRLHEMNEQAKNSLGEALTRNQEPALLRSAFDLPEAQRTKIQNVLNVTFSAEIKLQFETAPELINGIELSSNGLKVAWSITDYLASLQKNVADLLQEQDKTRAQTENSSALAKKIGKRAYALYEEQGHQDGHAAQNWEKAEQEIRSGYVEPAKSATVSEAEAKPDVSAVLKEKSIVKIASASTAEDKPAISTESKPETDVVANSASTSTTEAKPEANTQPKAEADAVTKPANASTTAEKSATSPQPKADAADTPASAVATDDKAPKPATKTQ
ncbi:MAG: DUF2934 domain-containing protein [Gallionellaceae bacterium]|jgi:F-type H+-transporting ATPase subunit b